MAYLQSDYTRIPPGPCPGCPLGNSRRVGARGNVQAPIAAIGEAPGGQELHKGVPFIGPTGSVLEASLPVDFDVDSKMLILNAMQCQPPKTSSQTKDKRMKSACVNACRQAVWDTLWAYPRKVLLLMGNWAAAHVLGDNDFKITKRRGEVDLVLDPIRGTEVQVVYAMHPASLLHGRGSAKTFAEDVHRAIELAYGTEVLYGQGMRTVREDYVEPTFEVLETPTQVADLGRRILQTPDCEIAGDLETSGFSPWQDRILCAGIYGSWDDNKAQIIPWRLMQDPIYAAA